MQKVWRKCVTYRQEDLIMKKRVLTFVVSLILMITMIAGVAQAGSHSSDISDVMYSFTMNNYSCDSAPQQQVNGSYRTVEMLEVIAKILDTKGKYASEISDVMYSYTMNNYSCKSAPQQVVNGTYRTVEML